MWELGTDFRWSLLFTHEERSGRFSSQTRSQQQENLQRLQVRGGGGAVAGTGRYILYNFCCSVFVYRTQASAHITDSSLDIFIGDAYVHHQSHPEIFVFFFHFCICRVFEMSSTCPVSRGASSRRSPAVFSHELTSLSFFFYHGAGSKNSRESPEPLWRVSGEYLLFLARLKTAKESDLQ